MSLINIKDKNMYKLIAVDIDGTLLNPQGIITKKTKEAIKYAIDKGIYFVLSTGRPIQGIYDIYEQLGLSSPAISYNGAIVLQHKNGPILYECSLLPNDTKAIIEKGDSLDTTVAIWYNSQLFTNKLNEKAYEYSTISNIKPKIYSNKQEIFEKGATKILYYDDVKIIEQYQEKLKDTFSSDVVFHTSKPYFLEFVNSKVSKANAMKKLGTFLNIEKEQMISIGDGFNDLAMIKYAGLGIAMGNAPQGVKEASQFITSSNDLDGVANAIYKYI